MTARKSKVTEALDEGYAFLKASGNPEATQKLVKLLVEALTEAVEETDNLDSQLRAAPARRVPVEDNYVCCPNCDEEFEI